MNNSIKVVAINCNKDSGGGKMMMELANYARYQGFDYITISPEIVGEMQNEICHITITSRLQKAINRELSCICGNDNIVPFAETKKLIKVLESIKPNVIHLHGLHDWYVDYIKLVDYIKSKKISTVWTQHDCWAFTGKCTHYESIKCSKWEDKCCDCVQLDHFPKSYFFDRTSSMFEKKKKSFTNFQSGTFVAVSRWMQAQLEKSFLKNERIVTIENGIDDTIFYPREGNIFIRENITNRKVLLGVAANWSEKKGFNDFIALRKKLNHEFDVILIGTDDRIAEICRENRIIPLPRISNKDVLAEYYSSCTIFLNLSKEETFGLVTAEAMACGTSVIGYDTTGTRELLKESENILVPVGDIVALENAIYTIMKNDIEKISMNNANRIKELYSSQKQYEKYLNLYRSIV